jgi:hypothetical protein
MALTRDQINAMASVTDFHDTLTSFSCSVSVGVDPVSWLSENKAHVLATLGEDKTRFTQMLVHPVRICLSRPNNLLKMA